MPRRHKRPKRPGERDRPIAVAIIAILYLIIAVVLLATAFAISALSSIFYLNLILGTIFGLGSFVLFIIGMLFLIAAYGLWKGESWAWWLGLIITALSILSIVLLNVVGFIIGVVVAYYMTRPNIKKWFKV